MFYTPDLVLDVHLHVISSVGHDGTIKNAIDQFLKQRIFAQIVPVSFKFRLFRFVWSQLLIIKQCTDYDIIPDSLTSQPISMQ